MNKQIFAVLFTFFISTNNFILSVNSAGDKAKPHKIALKNRPINLNAFSPNNPSRLLLRRTESALLKRRQPNNKPKRLQVAKHVFYEPVASGEKNPVSKEEKKTKASQI